jgi:Methyltransferase domain
MTQARQSPSHQKLREFFDRQQATNHYEALKRMTGKLDLVAADYLNTEVRGDALTIGGIWDFFAWGDHLRNLTVLDLSPEMLKVYCPPRARGIIGDLYTCEFHPGSFDSVVFPLMLHHTPQGSWRSSEARIDEAMARAQRWLRPPGRVFILEYCPHPAWYPLQRGLLPLTRGFLKAVNQPLVVMYTRGFYERMLRARFGSCEARRIDPEGFNYWAWYPVFMSIRWLKMPFAIYPKLHIFAAPGRSGAELATDLR